MKKAGIILASIVFAVLLIRFDYKSFWDALLRVPLSAFSSLLAMQVATQLLINYQWCRIGKVMGGASSFLKMLYVNAQGMIIESITPGAKIGGEVTRAFLLKKELGYSSSEAVTLVAIQKMVSLSSFFIINLAALTHISGKVSFLHDIWIKVLIYVFLILISTIFIGIFFFGGWLNKKIANFSPKGKWKARIMEFLRALLKHAEALKSVPGELIKQFLLSLLIWVLFPLKMVILMNLFAYDYDVLFLTEITFISYMVAMIPLLPGGLGSFEATMSSLLVAMQLPVGVAAAITVLFRFMTFWFVIIISPLFIGVWKLWVKYLEHKNFKKTA